jgi:hypothetical protein
MEQVLVNHPDAAECAAIGVADPLKGPDTLREGWSYDSRRPTPTSSVCAPTFSQNWEKVSAERTDEGYGL